MEICESCGKEYKTTSSLTYHRRQKHLEEFDIECPTCGKMYETEKGMRYHHSVNHGESIAFVQVECEVCGKTKEVNKNYRKRHERFFCSKNCEVEWKRENQEGYWKGITGEDHPLFGRSTMTEEGKKTLSDKMTKRVEKQCPSCGETNEVIPSYADNHDKKFCDVECYGKWLSENSLAEQAPNWRGGCDNNRGENWEKQRNLARERDGYVCRACGKEEENMNRQLDVHHIIPFRKFEGYEKANKLENLVSVCRSCHISLEVKQPDTKEQKQLITQ